MADIPGLIAGAPAGAGLGHEFLKHVERTRIFVHLVEPEPVDQTDPVTNYLAIRDELRRYDASLLERPEIIVVTKSELAGAADVAEKLREKVNQPVFNISAATGKGLPDLVRLLTATLETIKKTQPAPAPLEATVPPPEMPVIEAPSSPMPIV